MTFLYTSFFGKGGGASAFSPADLFALGEDGVWYDPSDLSTLWSDDARTTPASVDGAVAVMDDKSGNGKHIRQTGATARPLLRQSGSLYYLEFDGSNDTMLVAGATAAWGTVSNGFACAGYREVVRQNSYLFALSANNTASQRWSAHAPYGDGNFYFDCGGTSAPNRISAAAPNAAGTDQVGTFICSTTNSEQIIRVNGSSIVSDASGHSVVTDSSSGKDFHLMAADIGSGVGDYMDSFLYGFIFVKRVLTPQELSDVESWMATKSGVTL